ncbi:MAG: hypothetical protein COB49_01665 [Alphaproteobacteria bacterium]|nr:MAG: hypothetical protein COB49_01665 [Alphaproteobacteria bacterium]
MNKNIDHYLKHYSKINFQNNLKNLENDVNRRISRSQPRSNELNNHIERWFGIPASLGASIMALTLILGVFFGTQGQTGLAMSKHDTLGFEVFSVGNSKLPSSLLAPEL